MAGSALFEKIIQRELGNQGKGAPTNKIQYDVETTDSRPGSDPAVIRFNFSKPISEEAAKEKGKRVLSQVAKSLSTRQLGVVDAVLAQYGLKNKVGKKRTTGSVNVNTGDFEVEGFKAGIQTVSGKMISELNLRSLLEIVAKEYLIKDMKRPNAPLKYRTGRFANSLQVTNARVIAGEGKPNLSLYYTYMIYPYATFDPMKSTRPAMYQNPSYGARNPQVHIGDALAKAARDIIHSRYRIDVRQALS